MARVVFGDNSHLLLKHLIADGRYRVLVHITVRLGASEPHFNGVGAMPWSYCTVHCCNILLQVYHYSDFFRVLLEQCTPLRFTNVHLLVGFKCSLIFEHCLSVLIILEH